MIDIITERGDLRAVWLSELAAAIGAAEQLAVRIANRPHDPVGLGRVKARIAAVSNEIETLRRARPDCTTELCPDWMR